MFTCEKVENLPVFMIYAFNFEYKSSFWLVEDLFKLYFEIWMNQTYNNCLPPESILNIKHIIHIKLLLSLKTNSYKAVLNANIHNSYNQNAGQSIKIWSEF